MSKHQPKAKPGSKHDLINRFLNAAANDGTEMAKLPHHERMEAVQLIREVFNLPEGRKKLGLPRRARGDKMLLEPEDLLLGSQFVDAVTNAHAQGKGAMLEAVKDWIERVHGEEVDTRTAQKQLDKVLPLVEGIARLLEEFKAS